MKSERSKCPEWTNLSSTEPKGVSDLGTVSSVKTPLSHAKGEEAGWGQNTEMFQTSGGKPVSQVLDDILCHIMCISNYI